jgi:hypothetical protein
MSSRRGAQFVAQPHPNAFPPTTGSRPDRPEWLRDKATGDDGERKVEHFFRSLGFDVQRKQGDHPDYDLLVSGAVTVEVKTDRIAERTGRAALEVMNNRGRASGVAKTKAGVWAHVVGGLMYLIPVPPLRRLVEDGLHARAVSAERNAIVALVPLHDLRPIAHAVTVTAGGAGDGR